ncbi:prolyl 3-hydroxylase 2 [Cephus cinctus]|uniref:procollagen-proline 3-dioxygenase n=1 Tax=Cephus cinctus TaxID=211228 RepID=A0AAJ7BUA6_CEPCN|nr:prolyl 3-hydroxylase 2 [Cephus cinctus]
MHRLLPVLLIGALFCTASDLDNEIISEKENAERPEESPFDISRNSTIAEIFDNAVKAYLDEDWDECIIGFETALDRYKKYRAQVIKCRQKCKEEARGSAPLFPENIEDLHFYEKKIRETLCLLICNQDYRDVAGSVALKRLPFHTEKKFVERRPYEYLHICYYQKNRYQAAANAIYTFLVIHSSHEMSIKNLRYYLTLPEVKENDVINLENEPHIEMYIKGMMAYDTEDYTEAVGLFENSLRAYIKSEEDCRIYCEGPFDQGWHPEFTSSVSNHFAYCLKCKRGCSIALNNLNGNYHNDLLANHYHYLQFAYYKLGNLKEACAAVESYLLFIPADETMLQNRDYYSALPKVEKDDFKPREEALEYVKRQEYELRLLQFIAQEFEVLEAKFDISGTKWRSKKSKKKAESTVDTEMSQNTSYLSSIHSPPGQSRSTMLLLTNRTRMTNEENQQERKERKSRAAKQLKAISGIRIVAGEEELGGKLRYVADGFLNKTECNLLLQLAQIGAVEGDGYEENKSPHSKFEVFEGVTLGRAALMVYFGLVEPELLDLVLRSTEAARDHLERYLHLDQQLHFTYTHLVCRSALLDTSSDRERLSHAIHADNCLLDDQNNCIRKSPAYTWRDYSAILYLNDDFSGGEFIFAKTQTMESIQSTVQPRCGRMVGFSADGNNLHGVRGILRGKRCALALWFTHDEAHVETERVLARAVLRRVRNSGSVTRDDDFDIPIRHEDMLIERFREDKTLRHLLKN